MHVNYGYLLAGAQAARGIAVIIDVFRAFTCTPLMFSLGLKKSILVSQPHEALALKARNQDYILVGEVGGLPIEGFDLGNSPSQILNQQPSYFSGKTAVQRTSPESRALWLPLRLPMKLWWPVILLPGQPRATFCRSNRRRSAWWPWAGI